MTSDERETFRARFSDRPDFLPGPLDVVPEREVDEENETPGGS